MGGRGTMPYQPENIWEVVGLGTEKYKQDSGENLYRRTLYNFWKRMAPPASLELFNAPSRETSCVRRDHNNTPIQALVTMNDLQFVKSACVLAQSCLLTSADDGARGGQIYGETDDSATTSSRIRSTSPISTPPFCICSGTTTSGSPSSSKGSTSASQACSPRRSCPI
jgi:hypothetical protein